MTIGDEKVVQRWTPEICEDEQDGQIVAGMDPYTEGHYVLHSAYAELAAERDSFRDELSRWVHMLADKRAELQAAESQLAELRGRVSLYGQERAHLQDVNAHLIKVLSAIHMRCAPKDIEMADGTKRRFVPPDPEFYWRELSGKVAAIKAEIQFTPRTLAAADGGG